MNRAAVLCPGPSLATFPGREDYGMVIGVNRAALKVPVDVWACGDWPLYKQIQKDVLGSPLWWTTASGAEEIWERHERWRGPVKTWDEIDPGITAFDWKFFTILPAIAWPAVNGCDRIDIYGCDWSGEADFDGWKEAGNRTESRWDLERSLYGLLVAELERRGVLVKRMNQQCASTS